MVEGDIKSYKAEFTPLVRGRHRLEVSVNDQPMKGSPFKIVASEHNLVLKPIKVFSGVKQPGFILQSIPGER